MRTPITPRAYSCRCGRPIFFRNSECLGCHRQLGYAPTLRVLLPLQPADAAAGTWRESDALDVGTATAPAPPLSAGMVASPGAAGSTPQSPVYLRCSNLLSACTCNWLVEMDDSFAGQPPLCRCCRLTRTLPDLSAGDNALYWQRIEMAKRRLVSSLIGLQLPIQSKLAEDPGRGLVFDLLHAQPGGPKVMTGHDDGVITLDVEEADDARREQRRNELREPYRTLLGHLRHECGHYYWQRLVDGTDWLQPYRVVFGDERLDYAAALREHYQNGPRADWPAHHVSAYASSHPWEDWAETWAHYLHMVDTLDTANSFGVEGERVELHYERFDSALLADSGDDNAPNFLTLLNGWMELTGVLNELSRAMGMPDFYPFVLSQPAVRKLHFVHRVAVGAAASATTPSQLPAGVTLAAPAG